MLLKPLWESDKIYKRSLQAFLANSNARQSGMLNFTQDTVKESLQKIIEEVDTNQPLRVLSIGSGSGEADILILQTMAENFLSNRNKKATIQSAIVEPNSFLLDQFKMKASSLLSLEQITASVSFEWHQKKFREFNQESSSDRNSFDFIHFIHSIYFVDLEHALCSCFEQHLKADIGVILCHVQSEDSYFAKVSKRFKGKLSCGSGEMAYYTDEELIAVAEKHGWRYCVPVKQPFEINVSSCLGEQTDPSTIDDPLIDFLTQQQNFRTNADQELFHSVTQFIDSLAVIKDNGQKFVKGEVAAVILYK